MRVLVTGATGFLGAWVTRAFVQAGHRVRILVRATSSREVLKALPLEETEGDVLDRSAVARALEGVEAVVHCAGLVALRPRDREALFRVNVEGSRYVLEAARARSLRVLFTSTVGTLGSTTLPVARDECAGADARVGGSAYVESKRAGEELALAMAALGADVVVLNPGNALGPGDARLTGTRFVSHYLQGSLRFYLQGGMSFCDVRDVAAAYVSALERGRPGERYLLAGVNLSYGQLFSELWRLTGLHRPWPLPWPAALGMAFSSEMASAFFEHPLEELNLSVVGSGQRFTFANVGKAVRELGYRVRDFRATLADTLVDHLSRGSFPTMTPRLRALLAQHVP
ncbi:NAD-dependent epimerase/dehydratase family protein [Pyxidicoccus caerfyrddinensis]|uniref:NAD-dependent epimerase/dehydratase family protein n=1 Tax=Pyxidicoccus caerfyrddinensis TaxID=2709663 RepID=UPI0013DC49F2|nr:NAD-dependent epimerase/dehydratase family protein [Pyxidicoccus caerfyrddinensis]